MRQPSASTARARHPALIAIAMAIACLAGCRRDSAGATSASTLSSSDRQSASAEPRSKGDLERPIVRLETNQGAITLRLDAVRAPATVRNFLNYVEEGFYDHTIMHFVEAGSMIVAGGYSADRAIKPTRPPIRNEAHNGLQNLRGTVAVARDQSQIDSATSQFFINLADAQQRDHQGETPAEYGYCVFGEVIDGLDIAERISKAPTTDLGGDLVQTPDPPVVITSARVAH